MTYDYNSIVTKNSLDDITLPEKVTKFKNDEDSAARVKRQKSEFFTLLTTQLKNQDPLSPMDSSEMTSQIFAINHVEQQLETNRILGDIKKYFTVNQNSAYLNYIGKVIDFPGNQVVVESDNGIFSYDILESANQATIKIKDALGNTVHSELVDHAMGKNSFYWNKPPHLPNGIYTFSIKAGKLSDDGDSAAKVKLYSSGRVSSINNKNGEHFFEVGDKLIPVDEYSSIKGDSYVTDNILSNIKTQLDGIGSHLINHKPGRDTIPTTLPLPSLDDPRMMEEIKRKLLGISSN